jgi:divalent metal cation (Fe/Co/Zn/Cd) transporter
MVTLRLIAVSFFALAGFITWDAVTGLVAGDAPSPSTVGIVIAVASLVVMPTMSLVQRRAGREVGSHSAVADSKQTLSCSYMSAVLLVALLANSLADWWWADPLGALVIAGLAAREGINTWRGDSCCATPTPLTPAEDAPNCATPEDQCC